MAIEVEINILEEKHLSNPEALELLKKVAEKIREKEGTIPPLLAKTLEYLQKTSKISPEKARELREKLEEKGLKQESIVMIVNICPNTLGELRTLLELEEKSFGEEELKEILETVKNYCTE
ncbi:MAG: DNA-directed RNA polymerase subunit F [Thermoprotei archaeon]